MVILRAPLSTFLTSPLDIATDALACVDWPWTTDADDSASVAARIAFANDFMVIAFMMCGFNDAG